MQHDITPDADESWIEADTYPVLMVYTTVRLSARGGWSSNIRIATPDGKETIDNRGVGGGSIEVGTRKTIKYLEDAIAVAIEHLEPFPES